MSVERFRDYRLRNLIHTTGLLLAMGALLTLIGYVFSGWAGVILLAGMGLTALVFSPSFSPELAMRFQGAERLSAFDLVEIRAMLKMLAARAGMKHVPELYYLPSPEINAFAVGSPRKGAIALSDGLLRLMRREEIEGVLAHELSHLRHRDTRVMAMAHMAAGMTRTLSNIGLILVLMSLPLYFIEGQMIPWLGILALLVAPTVAAMLQLKLSRTRELDADLGAAELTGNPAGLARALARLEHVATSPWALLFPMRRQEVPPWLRTHPDTKERVARLISLLGPGRSRAA